MMHTYQATGRIEVLKRRVKRCVCKYCGGNLKLKRIIFSEHEDARVEIFCRNCDRIEYGVEPELYQSAKYFVEELAFNCFPNLDDNEQTRRMNVAKVCEIMAWSHKDLGIITEEGFQIPLPDSTAHRLIGECVILTEADLVIQREMVEEEIADEEADLALLEQARP